MPIAQLLGSALDATSNPDPNTLTTKNPYPATYVNRRTVSAAWTTQAKKGLFPTELVNGVGAISIPVQFVPSLAGATFTATVWQYSKLSNTWFKHQSNPAVNYTGETGNLIANLYDTPLFIQLSSISSGTISIYFDNGLAEAL